MLAVIRLRGSVNLERKVKDTLHLLGLDFANNCVVLPENESYKGMVQKVKDYITFGEVSKETLVELLKKRLRFTNDEVVDEAGLKAVTKTTSYDELAAKIMDGSVKLKSFKELQTAFKLHPPSRGFKSIKEHYPTGDLGNREKEINSLLSRMI